MTTPTPQQIYDTRHSVGMTQTDAGALIYKKLRAWQKWEAGDVEMDPAYWELFCIKVAKIKPKKASKK